MRALLLVMVLGGRAAADPTAAEIVQEMRATYAHASTYEQTATLIDTVRGEPRHEHRVEIAFSRDLALRFETRNDAPNVLPYIVWSDFKRPLVNDGVSLATRSLAVALDDKVFGVAALVVPLLLTGEAGLHGKTFAGFALAGSDAVNGHPCWHLVHGDDGVWIDRDSHLVRRWREQSGAKVTTLEIEPVVDAPVDPDHLARPSKPLTLEQRQSELAEAARSIIDKPAPAFAAERVSGTGETSLEKHRGHVLLLEFFSTWCPPCGPAADEIKQYKGVHSLALSSESPETITQFGQTHRLDYTLARDPGDHIKNAYRQSGVPSVVVIDEDGIVRDVIVGWGIDSRAVLDEALAKLPRRVGPAKP